MKWILVILMILLIQACQYDVIEPREVIAAPQALCPGSIDVTTTKITCYYVPKNMH